MKYPIAGREISVDEGAERREIERLRAERDKLRAENGQLRDGVQKLCGMNRWSLEIALRDNPDASIGEVFEKAALIGGGE